MNSSPQPLTETPVEDARPAPEQHEEGANVVAFLQSELEQANAERTELRDLLQRSRAEFENFRRRVEREKLELAEYGSHELMRAVAGVLDDFDRAVSVESADKVYSKGIELIHQRFLETLKKQGLEPIESKGRKFDPNVHEAVDRVPVEDLEEDTVLDEFQRGYNFKGRLLRPAMVRVGVKG